LTPRLELPSGEAHVWIAPAARLAAHHVALAPLLSDAELARIAGFEAPADRLRRTVARGCLRLLLAAYLGGCPAAVEIVQRCPECGGPHGALRVRGLCASLSYAPTAAVLAVARSHVGVDVEPLPPRADWRRAADAVLAPDEHRALGRAPERRRPAAFAAAWTRREAVGKAAGHGLTGPGGPWSGTALALPVLSQHAVALAVAEAPVAVRCRRVLM
jgi:4'-phosphopantetheinyl transferase